MEPPKGFLIGYARVSTEDQDLTLQIDALTKAGVNPSRIYQEKASGADDERPSFIAMFRALRAGDTLVVWKLDRLGRRLGRLIQTIDKIKERGAHLRVLTESIDTTTPTGVLMFHIIGAFAEFERYLVRPGAAAPADEPGGRLGDRRLRQQLPRQKAAGNEAAAPAGTSRLDPPVGGLGEGRGRGGKGRRGASLNANVTGTQARTELIFLKSMLSLRR